MMAMMYDFMVDPFESEARCVRQTPPRHHAGRGEGEGAYQRLLARASKRIASSSVIRSGGPTELYLPFESIFLFRYPPDGVLRTWMEVIHPDARWSGPFCAEKQTENNVLNFDVVLILFPWLLFSAFRHFICHGVAFPGVSLRPHGGLSPHQSTSGAVHPVSKVSSTT